MIFQDPMTSLNPVHRIGDADRRADPGAPRTSRDAEARDRVVELLERVGIPRAARARRQLPARVLGRHAPARDDRDGAVVRPVGAHRRRADDRARRDDPGADPASMQASCASGPAPAIILVTHDLGVVADIADRIARHVRGPDRRDRARSTRSSTTRSTRTRGACSGSIARVDRPRPERLPSIPGLPPSLINRPEGCHFRPRCRHEFGAVRARRRRSRRAIPDAPGHTDRCWLPLEEKRAKREIADGQIGLEAEGRDRVSAAATARRPTARCSRSSTSSSTSRSARACSSTASSATCTRSTT